jgi:hypothetical protein
MAEKIAELADLDLSMWFSTYGTLTSERILERFKIYLTNKELLAATKNPRSFYYQLLRIPLKNVFNGIILQQGHDYQVYAQKLFVDYLLSGESNKEEASPGANTREDLEVLRLQLMSVGEEFSKQELVHQSLIYESQASLIKLSDELHKSLHVAAKNIAQVLQTKQIIKEDKLIQQAIREAMIHLETINHETVVLSPAFWEKLSSVLSADLNTEIREQLTPVLTTFSDPREDMDVILSTYLEKTEEVAVSLRNYRSQFYNIILRVTEFIQLLPDYPIDKVKDEENRASLYFDSHIGGD